MYVGPSKNRNKKGLKCPWCPKTGRNDNVRRHMKTCPNRPEDGESVEAQSCNYNESSQAAGEGNEVSLCFSVRDWSQEEQKGPAQSPILGKRPNPSPAEQLAA